MISWDNKAYEYANECMELSWEKWEDGEIGHSWSLSFQARLAYLVDIIVDLVIFPFAVIGLVFSLFSPIFTCNANAIKFCYGKSSEKLNHFCFSVLGSTVSPALAHKHRDFNLTPYIIAARAIIGIWVLYAWIK